ncbi:hypothetical protein VTI74DRAFT_8821 [Chaetomium olivicolor]
MDSTPASRKPVGRTIPAWLLQLRPVAGVPPPHEQGIGMRPEDKEEEGPRDGSGTELGPGCGEAGGLGWRDGVLQQGGMANIKLEFGWQAWMMGFLALGTADALSTPGTLAGSPATTSSQQAASNSKENRKPQGQRQQQGKTEALTIGPRSTIDSFDRYDQWTGTLMLRIVPDPTAPDYGIASWAALLCVECQDVPRLMREGFFWSVDNVLPEEGYMFHSTKREWAAKGFQHSRRANAWDADGNLTYNYNCRVSGQNYNCIYDNEPLKGWWPWPKKEGTCVFQPAPGVRWEDELFPHLPLARRRTIPAIDTSDALNTPDTAGISNNSSCVVL